MKNVQPSGDASGLQKGKTSFAKHEFSLIFPASQRQWGSGSTTLKHPIDNYTFFFCRNLAFCALETPQSVFWIRDILVQIRIRGSVPLTNESGSWFFVSDTPIKNQIFVAFFFLKVHLHHSSKIKSHKKSLKTAEIKIFLIIFAWW